MKKLRIGNAAGFWGDNLDAPRVLAESGALDYLTLEYLAELTMSILAHQKERDPRAGFVSDFPGVVGELIPSLKSQPKLKIVTNAGGMNPSACAAAVGQILTQAGLDAVKVAAVAGDDVLPVLDAHRAAGEAFLNLDTGQPLSALAQPVVSANAYLGAAGIADALSQGARIVITGRVADASLAVGPCVAEFGWPRDDWRKLAQATVAGHIIECGSQATGGIYSAVSDDVSLADVGYPIAEIDADANVVITKPGGSGGLVTRGTVSEQIVYEIGDPAHYLTPDVDADFTQVTLDEEAPDRVRVTGATGRPRPERYKVSLAYRDGFTGSAMIVVCGPEAAKQARRAGEMVLERVRRAGVTLAKTSVEVLGSGDSAPRVVPRTDDAWEVVLRISANDPSREAIDRLLRELAPLVTSGPPGVTGYTGARQKARGVLSYWPTTIARDRVHATVDVRSAGEWSA